MIIKEFQINKNIIDNHNLFLFYRINEGLKDAENVWSHPIGTTPLEYTLRGRQGTKLCFAV